MRFISIGTACNVKYQIDKHNGGSETLFFDWLMTNMNSVITVLGCNNIDSILNINHIIKDPHDPIFHEKSRIMIKSLNYCISLHDVGKDFCDKDIFDFIDKYKRRYYRMIDLIKSDEKIYFLKCGKVNDSDKKLFIDTIKNINPKCDFALVSIDSHCDNSITKSKYNSIIKEPLFLEINISYNDKGDDWTTSHIDWNQIFVDIQQNI